MIASFVLDRGNIIFSGDVQEAILCYHHISRVHRQRAVDSEMGFQAVGHASTGDVHFLRECVLDTGGIETDEIRIGSDIVLCFEFELKNTMEEIYFSVGILDEQKNNCVWQMSNESGKTFSNLAAGRYTLTVIYRKPNLVPGVYTPTFALRNARTGETFERITSMTPFRIEGDIVPRGIVHAESEWELKGV